MTKKAALDKNLIGSVYIASTQTQMKKTEKLARTVIRTTGKSPEKTNQKKP